MSFLFINVNHDVGFESSESIPISLGYILATLKSHGWDGIILDDLRDRPLTLHSLEKWILLREPSVIGFTAYQSTMGRIRFFCRYIRSRHRRIKLILGGPQAAVMPPGALEELEDIDALIRGDGEIVIPAMAKALDAGDALEVVDGIACRRDGGIVDGRPGPTPPDDLDAYSSPYLTDLLNLEGKDTAILLSSRGCSHFCWFCITPGICKGKVRYHSIERTLDEMEHLAKRGIKRFWFADPNFTEDRQRTERLLEKKIERGNTTPFWCQTRSDLMDPPLLEKLRRAGADTIAFGLESGSPGVLAGTNKRIELDRVRENVEAAQALGMETELFTIFGLPNEREEDAGKTLEFVRSLGIPIQSNSGSQQMQLYFGSTYTKNPERYHFKPFSGYRPQYLSIGDDYETEAMPKAAMRRVRNRWALANEQMERDVYFKQRLFEVLDFLLSNREDLADDPAFYAYGALASCAIEEYELLRQFLDGYETFQNGNPAAMEELVSALNFFQQSDQPAGPEDRIIFDSRSWMDGVAFTGISGKYWDVLLGRGLLLESFEHGFIGARENEEIVFHFTFPDDYEQRELRGRRVEVQATIRKVFRSVRVATIDAARKLTMRNSYHFSDLDLLRNQNEILYYLALRDADPTELVRSPSHFLTLVHKLAKLAKRGEIERLGKMMAGNTPALTAITDTLAAAGKPSWALDFYDTINQNAPSTTLKRARCLFALEKWDQALALLESQPEGKDLEFQGTLLECLKKARPDSPRIPSLEHHVLNLRVESALQHEKVSRPGPASVKPLVHGVHPAGRSNSERD